MKDKTQADERSFYYRYCIVFKSKYANIVTYFKQLMKENDFEFKEFIDKDRIILLLSQTSEEKFLREAEHSKIKKVFMHKDYTPINGLPEKVIENEKRKNFQYDLKDSFVPDSYYDNLYNTKKTDSRYGLDLFTEAEMLSLEYKILEDVHLNENNFFEFTKNTPLENKIGEVKKFLNNDLSILQLLIQFKVIKDLFPLHVGDFRENLLKDVVSSYKIPYRKIRSYYGDYIAIYYAWIFHYTRFLLIPAIASIIITILSIYFYNMEKYLVTVYAIIVALWSQIFIVYWNRKCGEISIEWDNYTEEYDKENVRKEFKGEWRISPITEKYEKHYSEKKRNINYLISFLVSLPALLVSLFVNVCFLNLSGVILPHMNSFLEIEFLGKFAEKGRIFDLDGNMNFVLGIVHGFVLNYLNSIYRKIAEKTNDKENHRVKSNYENSLILKRFAFEFFNGFISFFYLAFVINDMSGLKSQLKSLFIANEIRRVLTETVVPNIVNLVKGNSSFSKIFGKGNKDLMLLGKDIKLKEVLEQVDSDSYETFDDYLELVLEFGYLTLFAECFPLAPVFIMIVNSIEYRSDLFKLTTVYKRPQFNRKRNIGSWHFIIQFLSALAVFTNLLLTVSPSKDSLLKGYINSEYQFSQFLIFFVLEHFVFILIILIRLLYKSQNHWVNLFLQRKDQVFKRHVWKKIISHKIN